MNRASLALCSLFLLPALHCDPQADRVSPPEGPAPAGTQATQTVPAATPAKQVVKAVHWPAHALLDESARTALTEEARQSVAQSPLPVLVPADPQMLGAAMVIARHHWLAVSISTPGGSVSLRATRVAHRHEHIQPAAGPRRIRGAPAFITRNAGIWSATWMEYGAAYTLELDCVSGDDPRCGDEAALLELAESLVYVGGARSGGAP